MMPGTHLEVFYVVAGRRRTVHRGVSVDGTDHIGTERCNLDDTAFPPRLVTSPSERQCRWCFKATTKTI